MVNLNKRYAAVASAIALLVLLLLCYPTDRRQIRKQFKRLSEWVSKEGKEGPLAIVQLIPEGRKFFADPCKLKAEAYGLDESFTPLDLAKLTMGARSRFETLSLEFHDLQIGFTGDGAAQVTVTARLIGLGENGESVQETHEIEGTLAKKDGRWLLARIKLIEVLKK